MAAKSITMKQRFNVPLEQVFPVFNQHATFNTVLWPIQSIVIKQSHDPDNADGVGSVRKMGVGPLKFIQEEITKICLLYTSPSPRDVRSSRMPSSA